MTKLNSKLIATSGFSIAVALMFALTVIGISRMIIIKGELESIVREHNVHSDLIATMRAIGHERVVSLYAVISLENPFEKDAAYMRYRELAGEFIKARQQLEKHHLTPVEIHALRESMSIVGTVAQLQDEVAELAIKGNTAAAYRILQQRVIPLQAKVFGRYSALLDAQRDSGEKALAEAEHISRFAGNFMISSGVGAIMVMIGIAVFVIRRTTEAEEALFQEKELAQVTLHSIGDAVITTNARGEINFINNAAERFTGWSDRDARGRPLREVFRLVDEETRQSLEYLASHALPDGDAVGLKSHSLLVRRDGQEFAVEDLVSPIFNREGEVIGAVVVFHDVTQSRQMARQMSWQATHDALTGLVNRREFERLLHELIVSAREENKHHAVLYMDLDQFKVVNDTCGHMAGDELLRQLVTVLAARCRESDMIARLGGDEFGMLLAGCPLDQAVRLANEVREAVQGFRFMWQDKSFEVGISIGLVAVTAESGNLAAVLSNADAACYAAKDHGRNRVHVYLEDDRELARRHGEMQWISRIAKAFEEQRFRLYFQEIAPVVASHREMRHFEVLLRMLDEQGEVIPPGVFIPAAERYNLMPTVDRWVIRTLFAARSEEWRRLWDDCRENGFPFPALCSINLSATTLNDEMFPAFLKEQIKRHRVPPQALCFEITETSAIANLNKASQFMHELSRLGCRFALDDFGSGMSSFAYLKDLPVHYLKIDGAFVRDMERNAVNHAMVEAIARIAHVMGIETVAEFVEDRSLLSKLEALGVDYAQGYGIHRPEPFENLAHL
ncbi:MAG: EAL domain-containing protein [Sulfuricella sp.]|nr:EAL domain-containing protein [Sulfuricella sp.]